MQSFGGLVKDVNDRLSVHDDEFKISRNSTSRE